MRKHSALLFPAEVGRAEVSHAAVGRVRDDAGVYTGNARREGGVSERGGRTQLVEARER